VRRISCLFTKRCNKILMWKVVIMLCTQISLKCLWNSFILLKQCRFVHIFIMQLL